MADPCGENAIYRMLRQAGIGPEDIETASSFHAWKTVDFADGLDAAHEAAGYKLIDLSLYLVWLLNIYQPNRALIRNLAATNVQIDALGRDNDLPAIKAVAKVVVRSLGKSGDYMPAERYADDLLALSRADVGTAMRAGSSKGICFERECAGMLEAGGYDVRATPGSGDFGADLIAEKHSLSFSIQCKDTVKPVGVKAVQEVVGSQRHYLTDFAVVCASGGFTDAAVELATSNKVILCNSDQLVRRLDAV